MALASTVPSSLICRRASLVTLSAVMPLGRGLALVLSTLPPNMGQSCGGELWASVSTVTLAPRNKQMSSWYFIRRVSHQRAPRSAIGSTRFPPRPHAANAVGRRVRWCVPQLLRLGCVDLLYLLVAIRLDVFHGHVRVGGLHLGHAVFHESLLVEVARAGVRRRSCLTRGRRRLSRGLLRQADGCGGERAQS